LALFFGVPSKPRFRLEFVKNFTSTGYGSKGTRSAFEAAGIAGNRSPAQADSLTEVPAAARSGRGVRALAAHPLDHGT
jgi:hypothetical protein